MSTAIRRLFHIGHFTSHTVSAVLIFSLCFTSGVANAAGGYIGAGFGNAESDFDTASVLIISGPNISTDEEDSSIRLFGGFQVDKNFSIEFAYIDFGEASAVESSFGIIDTFTAEVTGIEFTAVGYIPVNKDFSVFGRGGLILWDSDVQVCLAGLGCASGSDDGNDLVLGLGARYNFNKKFGVRAEYTLYDIDKIEAGTGDFSVLSVSAVINL